MATGWPKSRVPAACSRIWSVFRRSASRYAVTPSGRLVSAVPSGSYMTISHAASDISPEAMAEMIRRMNQHLAEGNHVGRTREVVASFFDGLDLLDPGVVKVTEWRPRSQMEAEGPTSLWGGVARKP